MKRLITVFLLLAAFLFFSVAAAAVSEVPESETGEASAAEAAAEIEAAEETSGSNEATAETADPNESASEQYPDIYELFQHWEQFGYPDYVGGVFSRDGSTWRLTVLLAGDDGSGEAQIRASLADTSNLAFGTSKYSYNELRAVQEEITANDMTPESGIHGCGAGWTSDGGFGESGKEFRVVVTVDKGRLAEYTDQLHGLYGDMVYVEEGERAVPMSAPIENSNPAPSSDALDGSKQPLWRALGFLLPVLILVVLLVRRRQQRLRQSPRQERQ